MSLTTIKILDQYTKENKKGFEDDYSHPKLDLWSEICSLTNSKSEKTAFMKIWKKRPQK